MDLTCFNSVEGEGGGGGANGFNIAAVQQDRTDVKANVEAFLLLKDFLECGGYAEDEELEKGKRLIIGGTAENAIITVKNLYLKNQGPVDNHLEKRAMQRVMKNLAVPR